MLLRARQLADLSKIREAKAAKRAANPPTTARGKRHRRRRWCYNLTPGQHGYKLGPDAGAGVPHAEIQHGVLSKLLFGVFVRREDGKEMKRSGENTFAAMLARLVKPGVLDKQCGPNGEVLASATTDGASFVLRVGNAAQVAADASSQKKATAALARQRAGVSKWDADDEVVEEGDQVVSHLIRGCAVKAKEKPPPPVIPVRLPALLSSSALSLLTRQPLLLLRMGLQG